MKKFLLWVCLLFITTLNFSIFNFMFAQFDRCEEGGYCVVSFMNDYGIIVGSAEVLYGDVVSQDDVQLIDNVKTISGGWLFEGGVTAFKFGETQISGNLVIEEVEDVCNEGFYHKNGLCTEYQYNGEIVHDVDDGTITLTYSGQSIKILDRNLGAENWGYGLDAPVNSYGTDYKFGGIFEMEDAFTIYKGWPNNPCEQIGGYIPTYKDRLKLLKLRGLIRLGNESAYDGVVQDYFDQIVADLLFPVFEGQYQGIRIDSLWSNTSYGYEHNEMEIITADTIDGFIDSYEWVNSSSEHKLRCFLPKEEKFSITFESMEKTVAEEKIPVWEYNNLDGGYKLTRLKVNKVEDPIETGYEFLGWYFKDENNEHIEYNFDNVVSSDLVLEAKWEKKILNEQESENLEIKSSGMSGGGGRRLTYNTSDVMDKIHESAEDKINLSSEEMIKSDQDGNVDNIQGKIGENFNASAKKKVVYVPDRSLSENEQAYDFAHTYGITTKNSVENAKMNSPLTRIQMAKMLSQYAINVLGKEPDVSKGIVRFNDVSNDMDKSYDNGVTLSYQLGIMGQNMPNNKFRPNDEVTRAEFVSAFSRMLYNTSDGEYRSTPKYYIHHMEKLKGEGIVTTDNPKMKEKRGYVMIMLMRSVK